MGTIYRPFLMHFLQWSSKLPNSANWSISTDCTFQWNTIKLYQFEELEQKYIQKRFLNYSLWDKTNNKYLLDNMFKTFFLQANPTNVYTKYEMHWVASFLDYGQHS